VDRLDLTKTANLTFAAPDREVFPATEICRRAIREDGIYPTVVNAANEVAVHGFLEGRLSFPAIVETVQRLLDETEQITSPDLETVFETDLRIREKTARIISTL
jgi:1-deoxy-D-xylulose-5-phosphate reductoisomerase